MGDMRSKLDELVRTKKEFEKKIHLEQSKIKLGESASTRIRTTMIGAMAAMEKFFGDKWGHGKPVGELSGEELENYKIKEKMRKEIFDLGNKQIKKLRAEMEHYYIHWNKYNVTIERND